MSTWSSSAAGLWPHSGTLKLTLWSCGWMVVQVAALWMAFCQRTGRFMWALCVYIYSKCTDWTLNLNVHCWMALRWRVMVPPWRRTPSAGTKLPMFCMSSPLQEWDTLTPMTKITPPMTTKWGTFESRTFRKAKTFKTAQLFTCGSARLPRIITRPCWVFLPSSPISHRMSFTSLGKVMGEFTCRPSASVWLLELPNSSSRWVVWRALNCQSWVEMLCVYTVGLSLLQMSDLLGKGTYAGVVKEKKHF